MNAPPISIPERAPGVAPIKVGRAGKDGLVFIEFLPSELRDVVRQGQARGSDESGRPADDAFGFKSAHDAVVAAQDVGARLLDHVVAQDLLFVFSESVQTLAGFPLDLSALDEQGQPPHPADRQGGQADQQGQTNPLAVVFCKLRHTDGLEQLRRAKGQDSRDSRHHCQASWAELQRIKERLRPFDHGVSLATPGTTTACRLLAAAVAYRHGAEATGYEHHRGAYKATLAALRLLTEESPHALGAAVAVLHDDREGLAGLHIGQHLVPEAVQLASQLLANLQRGPEGFYDGVLPVDLHGREAIARADRDNPA